MKSRLGRKFILKKMYVPKKISRASFNLSLNDAVTSMDLQTNQTRFNVMGAKVVLYNIVLFSAHREAAEYHEVPSERRDV